MIVFNGKLVITKCEPVGTTGVVWAVEANFTDNSGVFTARDIQVSDAVYASGTDFNGVSNYCGYTVSRVDAALTTTTKFVGELTYAEEYELIDDVGVPDVDADGMVCRVSSKSGFAMIPTDVSGLPQSLLDTARNISLIQRDYNVTREITTIVQEVVGSDESKLSTSGGTITGDLVVEGNLAGGSLELKDGVVSRVKVTPSDLRVALSGSTASATLSVDGVNAASTTEVVTSNGDVTTSRTLNAGGTLSDTVNVGGDVVSRVVQLQGVTRGTWGVTVNGSTTAAGITAAGNTEATVNVTASTTSPSGSSRVNLKASTVTADGALRVTDDAQFDGGLTAAGTVRGSKFFATSTDSTYQDTQLVTYQHLRQYLASELGTQNQAITDLLADKADAANVYTKAEVDSMVSGGIGGDGGDLTVNAAYQTGEFTVADVADNQLVTKGFVSEYVSTALDESSMVDDITNIQATLETKANSTDVYTTTEVDTMFLNLKYGDINTDEYGRFVTDAQVNSWTAKQDALGFTPENAANKGAANGYASLDTNGKLAVSQLTHDPIVRLVAENTVPTALDASTRLVVSGTQDPVNGLFKSFRLYVSDGANLYEMDEFGASSKTRVNYSQVVNLPTILSNLVSQGGLTVDKVLSNSDETKKVEPGTYSTVTVDDRGLVYKGTNPSYSNTLKGVSSNAWSIGSAQRESVYIKANVDENQYLPFIRYNAFLKRWEFSHDGYAVFVLGKADSTVVNLPVDFLYVSDTTKGFYTALDNLNDELKDQAFNEILGRSVEEDDYNHSFDLGNIADETVDVLDLELNIDAIDLYTLYFKIGGLI